ncbi:MAG: hypothetical protein M1834_009184 [Cirrosporium novae-zelandiae]|nr:MAG: hypothetical protein M1834_009184 [Cirrosporium novae-zelandiae]
MTTIKNVIVLGGASGNLGPHIVKALLDSNNFKISVLSRESSNSTAPEGVTVLKSDYSPDSLKEKFTGQDAVVSTIASMVVPLQKTIIDAAVDAGVKRFIPSEYGINTTGPLPPELSIMLGGKVAIQSYLKEKASTNPGFSWTALATGPFFDWGIKRQMLGLNVPTHSATIYDSGNEAFSTTTVAQIGRAVSRILELPDKTANQYLWVKSFTTTQNELISILEEVTGTKWDIQKGSAGDIYKMGQEKFAKKDPSSFINFLQAYLLIDGSGLSTVSDEEAANDLLGLPKEDLKDTIKSLVSS